jgi:hypothetical protein
LLDIGGVAPEHPRQRHVILAVHGSACRARCEGRSCMCRNNRKNPREVEKIPLRQESISLITIVELRLYLLI